MQWIRILRQLWYAPCAAILARVSELAGSLSHTCDAEQFQMSLALSVFHMCLAVPMCVVQHVACKWPHEKVVEVLLRAGANPNALNKRGRTPVHTGRCMMQGHGGSVCRDEDGGC